MTATHNQPLDLIATMETPADVRAWFDALLADGINFHPEDSFEDMIDLKSGERTFTEDEAKALDAAMDRTYQLVEDPCAIAIEAFEAAA